MNVRSRTVTELIQLTLLAYTLVFYVAVANAYTTPHVFVENGLVSVKVTDADLPEVIRAISERVVPPFSVKTFRAQKVTAQFSDVPVVEALRLLIQKNFTLILDKQTRQPLKVFLLNQGEGESVTLGEGESVALLDQQATNEFQEILKKTPEKEVRVHTILYTPLSLSEVKSALMGKNITLKSLQHTAGTQTGGYLLQEGQSMEEAFDNYERNHQLFLLQNSEQMQKIAGEADEPELRGAAQRGIADLDKVRQDFVSHGLRITNLELKGKAQDIAELHKDSRLESDLELVKPRETQER